MTTTEETMMTLTAAEIDQLEFLIRRPKWAGSDRAYDNMRKKLKRMGLIKFDRSKWAWEITEAGHDVLVNKSDKLVNRGDF